MCYELRSWGVTHWLAVAELTRPASSPTQYLPSFKAKKALKLTFFYNKKEMKAVCVEREREIGGTGSEGENVSAAAGEGGDGSQIN